MDYSYYYHAARHALDLHARLLTPENMQWLKSLPYEVREGDVHFCHGSPLNIEEFDYIFARDQAAQCLEIWDDLAPLTLIGHSHLCKSFALSPDGVHEVVSDQFELRPGWKYIVSVGSVGQPRDYDPRASYALYDTEKRLFEFRASTTTSRPRPRRSSAPTSSRTSATGCSSASDVTRTALAGGSPWSLAAGGAGALAPRDGAEPLAGAARAPPASRTIRCRRRPATPAGSARRWWPGRRVEDQRRHRPRHRGGSQPRAARLVALPEPAALGRAAGRRGATPKGLYTAVARPAI